MKKTLLFFAIILLASLQGMAQVPSWSNANSMIISTGIPSSDYQQKVIKYDQTKAISLSRNINGHYYFEGIDNTTGLSNFFLVPINVSNFNPNDEIFDFTISHDMVIFTAYDYTANVGLVCSFRAHFLFTLPSNTPFPLDVQPIGSNKIKKIRSMSHTPVNNTIIYCYGIGENGLNQPTFFGFVMNNAIALNSHSYPSGVKLYDIDLTDDYVTVVGLENYNHVIVDVIDKMTFNSVAAYDYDMSNILLATLVDPNFNKLLIRHTSDNEVIILSDSKYIGGRDIIFMGIVDFDNSPVMYKTVLIPSRTKYKTIKDAIFSQKYQKMLIAYYEYTGNTPQPFTNSLISLRPHSAPNTGDEIIDLANYTLFNSIDLLDEDTYIAMGVDNQNSRNSYMINKIPLTNSTSCTQSSPISLYADAPIIPYTLPSLTNIQTPPSYIITAPATILCPMYNIICIY